MVPRDYFTRLIEKQKAISQLVRSHTAQAQMRQKQNHDKRMKEKKPSEVGDYVWVFINVLRRGGTGKLLRGWRGPFQIVKKHQEGRWYVLSSGHKVHFERLKVQTRNGQPEMRNKTKVTGKS